MQKKAQPKMFCNVTTFKSVCFKSLTQRTKQLLEFLPILNYNINGLEGNIMTDNELLLAISNMIDPIRENIQEMKQDIKELKTRVKKIEITQENEILPRVNTIESCYTSTYDRYQDSVEDYESIKQDISILKKVVTEHSEKLQRIG